MKAIPALHQQVAKAFLAAIPAPQTPVMIAAVSAWTIHELGWTPTITGNNPWNLHAGRDCPTTSRAGIMGLNPSQALKGPLTGQIGNRYAGPGDRSVAIFDTLAHGVAASVQNLVRPWAPAESVAYGYDHVLATAKSGDPLAFLDALAKSSWSEGRYKVDASKPAGGTNNGLVALYRTLQAPTNGGSNPVASLKTEPLLALGAVGTIAAGALVAITDAKIVTLDQGQALVGLASMVLPIVLAAIGRQFVTPVDPKPKPDPTPVPEPATPPVVTLFDPAKRGTTAPGTPRWTLAGADLATLQAPGHYVFDAQYYFADEPIFGHFLRVTSQIATDGTVTDTAPFLVAENKVTFGDKVPTPEPGPREDPTPLPVVTDDWFVVSTSDDPYILGGAKNGNPNGPDWRPSEAKSWFRYVVANKVGYHHVRPTLLPGSHVLTATGIAQMRAFETRTDLIEAPEAFNPLNLTVVA